MTYTYDPSDLTGRTVSRARFELGDVLVDDEGESCMLCDEEIQAIINECPKWKRALFRLADAVCMRLSLKLIGAMMVRNSTSINAQNVGLICVSA